MVTTLVLEERKEGVWCFLGSVPACLAYETDAPPGEARDYLFRAAAMSGPGLARDIAARRGFTFKQRIWSTEADALAAAAEIGARVTQVCPRDKKAWRALS
jgi:hypothetical protein